MLTKFIRSRRPPVSVQEQSRARSIPNVVAYFSERVQRPRTIIGPTRWAPSGAWRIPILRCKILVFLDFTLFYDDFVEPRGRQKLSSDRVPLAAHRADVKRGVRPADRSPWSRAFVR